VPARYRTGTWVAAARGDDRVREAVLSDGTRLWTERCDVLCCGYGLVPNLELPRHLGCGIARDAVIVDELAQTTVPAVFAAGEVTGIAGVESSLAEGEIAGLAAAGWIDAARSAARALRGKKRFAEALAAAFAPRPELLRLADAATLVCRCEDVRLADLDPRWTVRQAKLYTRAGMGPCQGRVCGPALAHLFGWETDRVRPPLRPVPVASLAVSGGDEG
jgi:NADPH-dependent 2,4-dienoyl-CoA reductase/sulfur reductase-like enzyme